MIHMGQLRPRPSTRMDIRGGLSDGSMICDRTIIIGPIIQSLVDSEAKQFISRKGSKCGPNNALVVKRHKIFRWECKGLSKSIQSVDSGAIQGSNQCSNE